MGPIESRIEFACLDADEDMSSLRDEFVAALKQTADRLDRVVSLWPANTARDDLTFVRDLMRSRRNQLRHRTIPMYVNEAQTCSDLLDRVTQSTSKEGDADFKVEVTQSLEPLRLVIRKYARTTDRGLQFPSEDEPDGPRLPIRR